MKIVIAATPAVAIPSIEALRQAGHELLIVTQPDRPAGRGLKVRASQIAQRYPDALRINSEAELVAALLSKDLLVTIGYGRILRKNTLEVPKLGSINLHFSLLPKWRGAAPVQRAIEAGDKITGVTVFQMDEGMDTGPIFKQKELEIGYGMDALQLFDKLADLGAKALIETIGDIQKGVSPSVQIGGASLAPKITKEEARIDWNDDNEKIIRKIKAFVGGPIAHTTIRGDVLKIVDAHLVDKKLKPGVIDETGVVGTGNGSIQLQKVIPAGKRAMSVKDWLNGFELRNGETLGQ